MRKRPLLWFACVFLSGLAYARYERISLLLVPFVFVGIEIYYGVNHKNYVKAAGRSMILLSAFLLGIVHMNAEQSFRARYMSELQTASQEVLVWGEIIEIKHTDYGVRMRLSDCYVRLKEERVPCNDVLVYASSTQFQVGEIHKITGKLNLFENARNQGGFDSKTFYQSQKIDFAVKLVESKELAQKMVWWKLWLLNLKQSLLQVYSKCMDERAEGFFSGLILGDKTNLEEEIKDLFALGGISHVLAISGLHVSVVGRNFYQLLRKCGLRFTGAGIIAAILLMMYGFLVGNSMSATRAIGMMLIFFLGQSIGRSYDMLNSLGAMILILLWGNPFFMEYSGFWLSVMALIGVGFVGEIFGTSLGVALTTLPVVACCYYEIPLYSPVVNALALPLLTPMFLLALLGGVVGLWIPVLAKILLTPCSWGLGFYIWICEMVKRLPFASVICGKPRVEVIVLYYLVLATGVILLREKVNKKGGLNHKKDKIKNIYKNKWKIGWVTVFCFVLLVYPKEKPAEITFLDVGQGDAVYISSGDNSTFFIDGGSTSEEKVGEYCILPFLKYKGISRIDYWFVSHADKDHISGLQEVIESGYEIGALVVSEYAVQDEELENLILTAQQYDVRVLYMDAGDEIRSDNATFTCLYPWTSMGVDKNDASMVLAYKAQTGKNALFAGDISSDVELLLLQHGKLKETWLYKASHHGSKYSNSKELLKVLQPKVTVVSCAKNNLYGHPHQEVIERLQNIGTDIYYTMENGRISFYEEEWNVDK